MTKETTPTETTVADSEAPASLTVQDLANLRRIIDLASQRGAFKANEFTVVGATYTKLSSFIEAITPATEETTSEATEETAEVVTEDAGEK